MYYVLSLSVDHIRRSLLNVNKIKISGTETSINIIILAYKVVFIKMLVMFLKNLNPVIRIIIISLFFFFFFYQQTTYYYRHSYFNIIKCNIISPEVVTNKYLLFYFKYEHFFREFWTTVCLTFSRNEPKRP